jgi:DNA-binding MarR family transcriptional regulator
VSNPNIDLCLTFHRAYAKLRLQLDEELGIHHGMDFDDFALLHLLARAEDDPMRLGILAAALGASRSAMLRRLRPLEKIGLIACHGNVADRRIALRPAGLSLMKAAHDTAGSLIGDVVKLKEALLRTE